MPIQATIGLKLRKLHCIQLVPLTHKLIEFWQLVDWWNMKDLANIFLLGQPQEKWNPSPLKQFNNLVKKNKNTQFKSMQNDTRLLKMWINTSIKIIFFWILKQSLPQKVINIHCPSSFLLKVSFLQYLCNLCFHIKVGCHWLQEMKIDLAYTIAEYPILFKILIHAIFLIFL